jgi:alpha-glucosidase
MFGGPAWEPVGDGQFYLHLFAREQPDFNWENQEVRADFLATLRFWSDRGVDGFRVDVAHGLAKDLTADPLATWAELDSATTDGSHPFWDRDGVHSIYAEWRKVLNEYDPPRTAVAEAWVAPSRRARFASPDSLGQSFNFDLLSADFDAGQFRVVITEDLALSGKSGSSSTWVLSNHDVVRHATRYGLPPKDAHCTIWPGRAWLLTGGTRPALERNLGLRRARAATLLMLALPGSAYLYQGEELGLHEIADIPDEARQDPTFFRNGDVDVGRDGCRIPLPWSAGGPSFGFGTAAAHLPQPAGFGRLSVETQEGDPSSTLWMYRDALRLRRRLQSSERLRWVDSGYPDVLHFQRDGGWESVTNFQDQPIALPDGEILISSSVVTDGRLPANSTAWLVRREPETPGKHVREG